jgi:hypothetical protein
MEFVSAGIFYFHAFKLPLKNYQKENLHLKKLKFHHPTKKDGGRERIL